MRVIRESFALLLQDDQLVVEEIAAAHRAALPIEADPWIDAFESYIDQNEAAFGEFPDLFAPDAAAKLIAASRDAFARLLPLLRRRGQSLLVRRGHGDLHLGNIALIDGKPVLFDAIEFDPLVASGDVLLFLHADCRLPDDAIPAIERALATGAKWGRFDVTLAGRSAMLPVVARMMNVRSRLTGIATGDQGLFVTRGAFDAVGGFPALPLMEDVAMSGALRSLAGRPACIASRR